MTRYLLNSATRGSRAFARQAACATALALATLPGCMTEEEWRRAWDTDADKRTQPTAAPREVGNSAAVRDTIAPLVTLQGMRLNRVRGFGIVMDLVTTGGSDGPEVVRTHLIKEIRRRSEIGGADMNAVDLLNSRDTAMVEIVGSIPVGAKKGDRFDIQLKALGSETSSIAGGRLLLGQLALYADTPSGVIAGKTLATSAGPVFVTPFDRRGESLDAPDLTRGVVLGGGFVTEDRRIRLVLNEPRHSIAKQIERRINGRFGGGRKLAEGESASFIKIDVPPEYHNRRADFLALVLHLTINDNPQFLQTRIRDCVLEFDEKGADFSGLALVLEGIGKSALPDLHKLYGHANPAVQYFAGRTGLRLEDRAGMEVIIGHANDASSEFRLGAISELGRAERMYAAGEALKRLLSDKDDDIRIAAYKALRTRRPPHPAIQELVLDRDNLVLHIVESEGPYLVHVQRTGYPCVALFGRDLKVNPPIIFPGQRKDGRTLISQLSANAGDKHLSFIYRNKRNGTTSPVLQAPLYLAELIRYLGDEPQAGEDGRVQHGFAVPFSEICDILLAFMDQKALSATMIVDEVDTAGDDNERLESEF